MENSMLNKILIVSSLLALTLVSIIIWQLVDLSKYQQCMTTPISNLPEWCAAQ
jgi:hypothetical protein